MRHPGARIVSQYFYTEQIGGAYGLYSTYNVIQEAKGPFEFRFDGGYVHSDGQRDNSAYDLWQANGYLGYRPDKDQLWALDVHISRFDGGDPGQITYRSSLADPEFSPQPFAHNGSIAIPRCFGMSTTLVMAGSLQAKAWVTNQDIDSIADRKPPFARSDLCRSHRLQLEDFWNGGVDIRLRKNWGDDTMFKGSTLTLAGRFIMAKALWQYNNFNSPTAGTLTAAATRPSTRTALPITRPSLPKT